MTWSFVYAWIVVMSPLTMPNSSSSTLAIGARQFVVHEALEMTSWLPESYCRSLMPMTIVMSSFFAGAEMMTFLAPASRCARALVASVKWPGRLDDDVGARAPSTAGPRGRARRAP